MSTDTRGWDAPVADQITAAIAYECNERDTHMHNARVWRARPQGNFQRGAVCTHVRRAREANRYVMALQRRLHELEVMA